MLYIQKIRGSQTRDAAHASEQDEKKMQEKDLLACLNEEKRKHKHGSSGSSSDASDSESESDDEVCCTPKQRKGTGDNCTAHTHCQREVIARCTDLDLATCP